MQLQLRWMFIEELVTTDYAFDVAATIKNS